MDDRNYRMLKHAPHMYMPNARNRVNVLYTSLQPDGLHMPRNMGRRNPDPPPYDPIKDRLDALAFKIEMLRYDEDIRR